METQNYSTRISNLRNKIGLSQDEIAQALGVSRVTIVRWEKGASSPSKLAIQKIQELESADQTKLGQVLDVNKLTQDTSKSKSISVLIDNRKSKAHPSPYVINGPIDQNEFHSLLIKLQEKNSGFEDWDKYKSRISLLQEIDGEQTSQFKIESPRDTAKSWNSNYGSHGWHRYVGRFPPHLVRSLINYFGATSNDLICDPFAGSGTTLVEARLLGVPAVGIEICPLSKLISETKTKFTSKSSEEIITAASELQDFYDKKQDGFLKKHKKFKHADVLNRQGNNIGPFTNIEKWFTPEALLGTSIVTEFAESKEGYIRDAILIALSAKMRSIGNVDVDVIRAEYSKKPRENVDVLKLVTRQLLKMARDINDSFKSHHLTIGEEKSIKLVLDSALKAKIKPGTVSHIITSPPYGVESLSYLRTHLLSYRSLGKFLDTDPYQFGNQVIGSEYLPKSAPDTHDFSVSEASKTFNSFFDEISPKHSLGNKRVRLFMMMKFFQDMNDIVDKFHYWMKGGGKVAFVVGNKRIGDDLIPTHEIMEEIFLKKGFKKDRIIAHKLKTNNSNSQVPWQDRVIDQEFIMIFEKK